MKVISKINSFIIICFLIFLISYSSNLTIEETRACFKEIAYSYYMRGPYIQYNVGRDYHLSPEDITKQYMHCLTCAAFPYSIFLELLNISLFMTEEKEDYYLNNMYNRPEIIAYAYKINETNFELKVKSEDGNGYKIIKNPKFEDVLPYFQIGDILSRDHHLLVYDLVKDKDNKVIDVISLDSAQGASPTYINTKISYHLSRIYLNNYTNTKFEEGRVEASIKMKSLLKDDVWGKMDPKMSKYVIFRFLHEDSKGNPILKFPNTFNPFRKNFSDNDTIYLNSKNLDRLKFKHLYIEKTCNKHNNNIVILGSFIIYKIIIKNNYKNDYNDDLIVIENLSKFVTFHSSYQNKTSKVKFERNAQKLIWNIGKLKKGETIIIHYIVRVTSGKLNDVILSTGFVGNIESSTIRNTIGINLNENQKNLIINNYESLKKKYNGKRLINEIYKKSFNIDMKFDKFEITNLILNKNISSSDFNSLSLNNTNPFYDTILNNYWSALYYTKDKDSEGKNVNIYNLKRFQNWVYFNIPEKIIRRGDFIYKDTLETGDILIYKNNDDVHRSIINGKINSNKITNENGEYVYIYIKEKGFVGINYGDDGIPNTKDDRNEFNAKYYKYNNLTLYIYGSQNFDDETLENFNLQTVFGKDYYAILRPSLYFNFQNKAKSKTALIIFLIIFGIIVLIISGILFYIRRVKKSSLNDLIKGLLNN